MRHSSKISTGNFPETYIRIKISFMKALINRYSRILLVLLVFMLSFFTQPAMGAEFVLMNRIITWDVNAKDAFWSVMPDASMPSNWMSPDNYADGMIYSRYEIISVATSTPCAVGWGFFQWRDAQHTILGELCELAPTIAGTGAVGYKTSSPSTWWQTEGGIDFSSPEDMQSMGPVIYSKNPGSGNGWPVSQSNNGGDPGGVAWADRHKWFPITVRVTVIAVSEGSTFSGWDNYVPNPAIQKPTPNYGIDFINETTDKIVPSTDEFSQFPTMYGAVTGNGQKMALIPGRDAYFRTKAGDGLKRSEIQHFDIPCRPATPKFVLDKVNHRTTTVVSSEYEYSDFSDMSGAITGNNTYVSIAAGTTKYFRKKATGTSFRSNIQALNESAKLPIAHEMLVFNDIIDFPNNTDTNGFYYFYYNADMPKDWTTPDDYYNGVFYMRFEIISQKTSTPVGLQFGLWQLLPPETGELHETMSGIRTLYGPGNVGYLNSSPSTWWRLDSNFDYTQMDLTWHMGINPWKMDPYYGQNLQIRQENPGVWAERNTYWFPMKVYVTIVAVASGYSFSGWDNYLGVKAATPSYSINYATEKTSQVISATDEYSFSPTMSPAYNGNGAALDLQPGQNVYFRTKANGKYTESYIQRLIVPARPTPSYTVNYLQKTTNEPVSANDEYSTNSNMSGALTGTNSPVTVTPGIDLYFRTKATDASFQSEIQALDIPPLPDPPVFTINYNTTTTNETAGTNITYSKNSNFSSPMYGTGQVLTLEPGQDLYIKKMADNASFASNMSHLIVPATNFLGYSGADTVTTNKVSLYVILADPSDVFTLNDLQVTNATVQNLRAGNVFDVYPVTRGPVSVVIPANAVDVNTFASNEVTFYYDVSTGIENNETHAFTIYPNPSSDGIIYIRSHENQHFSLEVLSVDGHILKTLHLSGDNQPIYLHDLPKGMYFIKISGQEGTGMHKLILK